MTPKEVLCTALSDGVSVAADGPVHLKITGDPQAIDKWLPAIREHKSALLAELSPRQTTPAPCKDCPRLETVDIQGVSIPGCLYQAFDSEYPDGWRRLPVGIDNCLFGNRRNGQRNRRTQ